MGVNATIIEQVWFICTLVAWIVIVWNLFDAIANLNYVDATGANGRRRLLAQQHIRSGQFLLVLCCIKCVVAGSALFKPEQPMDVSLVGWMTASFLVMVWSVLDARTRHALRKYQDVVGGRRVTDIADEDEIRPGHISERRP